MDCTRIQTNINNPVSNNTATNNMPNLLKQHQEAAKARLLEQQAKMKEQMEAKKKNEQKMIESLKAKQVEEAKKNELNKKPSVNIVQSNVQPNDKRNNVVENKKSVEIPKQRDMATRQAQEMFQRQQQEVLKKAVLEDVKKRAQMDTKKPTEVGGPFNKSSQEMNAWNQIQQTIKKEHEHRLALEQEKKRQEQIKAEMEMKKKIEEEKAKKEAELRAVKERQRQMELKRKQEEEMKQELLRKQKEEQRKKQWQQHQEYVKKEKQNAQPQVAAKPIQNLGKPIQNLGKPAQNLGKPAQNLGKPTQNLGKPAQNLGKPTIVTPTNNSSNKLPVEQKNVTQHPFKTTVTQQQQIQSNLTPQAIQINKPIKLVNSPSINAVNNLPVNRNADISKKEAPIQKNVKPTDTNKSSASDTSIRSIIKLYPFSQLINIMPPIQLPHGDENAHHSLKEDNSWLKQHRIVPDYEIPQPKKMEIPEMKGSVIVKPTVIPHQVVESTKVHWNEFPEDPQYEIERGQKVKTQEWVPVNDEEKIIPKASYKPSRISRVWPPPEAEREYNNDGVLKVKASDDTAWIQNQNESLYPAWQQKTNSGSVKSRVWPPPEQDLLGNGYSGPSHMGPVQWPPPEFEEHEQEIVEVLQTHLPVNKHQRQWPPEPPKMVPAGTIQNE